MVSIFCSRKRETEELKNIKNKMMSSVFPPFLPFPPLLHQFIDSYPFSILTLTLENGVIIYGWPSCLVLENLQLHMKKILYSKVFNANEKYIWWSYGLHFYYFSVLWITPTCFVWLILSIIKNSCSWISLLCNTM